MEPDVTTATFSLLSRMSTGSDSNSRGKSFKNTFIIRSFCLTKNYCGKECLKADLDVHTVCCKNLLDVDKRKRKKGGKEKEETASLNLEAFQTRSQLNLHQDEHQTQLKEVVSNMKKMKVKEHKKKAKVSEVD